jgi:catechol 2,3-dioxygenase-like lactoylglutathione lyase family enzyme
MITGINHASFTVSDMETTEQFFAETLNMKKVGDGEYDFDYIKKVVGYPDALLKIAFFAPAESPAGAPLVELIEYVTPKGAPADTATNRPGNAHLCLQVDDIDGEYERLQKKGVRFLSAPQEVIFGLNKGAKAVYCDGPDHIKLELYQRAPV